MTQVIKGMSPALKWLSDLLSFFQVETITIPSEYRDQVIQVKNILKDDTSGLVNTMLDFAIECAIVSYKIESDNENLQTALNTWLKQINFSLRGKIPTGIDALAKEYFRERWKSSSFLLLRTFWEKKDGLTLPTTLFFVDGEDIHIRNSKEGIVILGDEKYSLRINDDKEKDKKLPSQSNETIFVQKPYESWGTRYPTPYIIRKGLYRNMAFMNLMNSKSELIVGKALEYLLFIKKGTERMLLDGNISYDEKDIQKVSDDLKALLLKRKNEEGTTTYTANFDTIIEHLIPDYQKVLNESIYAPLEKRLLAGLGLVDIVEGTSSSRRESILNPKPFVSEVKQGIKDFTSLLTDIMQEIIIRNEDEHRKWMNARLDISHTPIAQFMTDNLRTLLRSLYDRGVISKRTLAEVVGEMNYELEVERRQYEKEKEHNKIMYPPIIQNLEQVIGPNEDTNLEDQNKLGPEAENYDNAAVEITENYIRIRQVSPSRFQQKTFRTIVLSESKGIKAVIGRLRGEKTTTVQSYLFDKTKWTKEEAEAWVREHKGADDLDEILYGLYFEEAPYTKTQHPAQIKNLPAGARSIWIETFNSVLRETNSEDQARMAAWRNVKLRYKKIGDKWVRKSKGEIEKSEEDENKHE